MRVLKWKWKYFVLTILFLLVEVFIAVFIKDNFIRPYAGDFLVVILIYCFIRSFFDIPVFTTALTTLIFAYSVEVLQYFNIAHRHGIENTGIVSIIIGNSFEWADLVAYTAGIIAVLFIEKYSRKL